MSFIVLYIYGRLPETMLLTRLRENPPRNCSRRGSFLVAAHFGKCWGELEMSADVAQRHWNVWSCDIV